MARAAAVALVLALGVAVTACGDDAPSTAAGHAATSSAPVCDGCRVLRVGTDARLDGASIGVRRCADGTCSLAVVDADGTESRRTVRPGDTLGRWRVESVSAGGLVVTPP